MCMECFYLFINFFLIAAELLFKTSISINLFLLCISGQKRETTAFMLSSSLLSSVALSLLRCLGHITSSSFYNYLFILRNTEERNVLTHYYRFTQSKFMVTPFRSTVKRLEQIECRSWTSYLIKMFI